MDMVGNKTISVFPLYLVLKSSIKLLILNFSISCMLSLDHIIMGLRLVLVFHQL